MSEFIGEVKPIYSRWHWPFREMKHGDWFIVAHDQRRPEDVRNYVSVRAAQLNMAFSVMANDAENPGFTRVTCVPFGQSRETPDVVMKYEAALARFSTWFAVDIDETKVWMLGEVEDGAKQVDAQALIVAEGAPDRVVFKYSKMTVGMEREGQRLSFYKLPSGWTLSVWLSLYDQWRAELEAEPVGKSEEDRLIEYIAEKEENVLEELRIPFAKSKVERLKENRFEYERAVREMNDLARDPLADIMA